jgi:hypothetical protein
MDAAAAVLDLADLTSGRFRDCRGGVLIVVRKGRFDARVNAAVKRVEVGNGLALLLGAQHLSLSRRGLIKHVWIGRSSGCRGRACRLASGPARDLVGKKL